MNSYNKIEEGLKKVSGKWLLPGTGTTYGIFAAVSMNNNGVKISEGHCPVEYLKKGLKYLN